MLTEELQEPGLALVQQCYLRDARRTEVILCYPSGDTATAQPKGIYFPLERSGTRNGFQRHRPLVFAKQLGCPCLTAEQRVWLMKRCQNDNPYYQEIVDRIFFPWQIGGWWEEWEQNRKAKRETRKREGFWREKTVILYIYIKYNLPSAHLF